MLKNSSSIIITGIATANAQLESEAPQEPQMATQTVFLIDLINQT